MGVVQGGPKGRGKSKPGRIPYFRISNIMGNYKPTCTSNTYIRGQIPVIRCDWGAGCATATGTAGASAARHSSLPRADRNAGAGYRLNMVVGDNIHAAHNQD